MLNHQVLAGTKKLQMQKGLRFSRPLFFELLVNLS
ncbi:hypothetical protein FP742_05055 [Vibrio parahaemolyticus]|uniref:Uncharacterized protein n=1 Tax=Vibrio parahaemolyticus serotype O3:K6 (strain RIMD 2210633) TaxID=223926 RepID=Q87RX1_VIBPA|nr:hypothetical protein A6J30_25045 [Vibrio parahaemolyticus]BAC58918.1 hypothetical protein [Vibrio parahaemolyticus RIMD 2210633]AZV71820.1 hypothetical protein D0853_13000 [Vibrio parahaemolyticus]EGQ8099428.1 hypothetical protein [Vibrio parahaemolyticus]EGQ8126088.1 hypothetical protein [Vibrio parahaemolyticus]